MSNYNISFAYHIGGNHSSLEALFPEEKVHISNNWNTKRISDFINGRLAGHKATIKLKGHSEPIIKDDTGVPIWKSNSLKGSISHKDNIAVSVITGEKNIQALGIDIEVKNQKISIEECCLFCNEKETSQILKNNIAPIFLFSIKEAVFKAHSTAGKILDFKEIDSLQYTSNCHWWNIHIEGSSYFLVVFILRKYL